MLNHEEIKNRQLIENYDDNNFKNASYDIRIEKIITINGKEKTSYKIKPNSMATAISKEFVKLPNNIIGHAYVKTRLSQKGIMANNIGLIDTEYEGQLSTVLVNFGKTDFLFNENDAVLRITFTEINTPTKSIPINFGPYTKKEYLGERRSDSMSFLGNSFINIDRVVQEARKEIQNSLRKTAQTIGIWIAAIGLIFTAIAWYNSTKDDTTKKLDNLQNQINSFNENQLLLLNIQNELESNIVSLKNEIDSIRTLNDSLINKQGK